MVHFAAKCSLAEASWQLPWRSCLGGARRGGAADGPEERRGQRSRDAPSRWDTGHCSSPGQAATELCPGASRTQLSSPRWQEGLALSQLHPNLFLAGSKNPSVPPGAETSPLISQRAHSPGFQPPRAGVLGVGDKISIPHPGALQSPRHFATQCFADPPVGLGCFPWPQTAPKARLLRDAEVSRKGQAVASLLPCPPPALSATLRSSSHRSPALCFILSEGSTRDPAGFNIWNEALDSGSGAMITFTGSSGICHTGRHLSCWCCSQAFGLAAN